MSKTKHKPKFVPLKIGATGPRVVSLQNMLNQVLQRKPPIPPTGNFGPLTNAALVEFQKREGLTPLGTVTEETWNRLLDQSGRAAPLQAPATPIGPANWMIIANQELEKGVHEVKGKVHNEDIVKYHQSTSLGAGGKIVADEVAWCSSFVNWCLEEVNIEGTDSAAAASWLTWGQKSNDPAYGAITVLYNRHKPPDSPTSGNHVGFLISSDEAHYTLLGGNQSDSVCIKNFAKTAWKLKGFRFPA
jgi:uncharacterized protein (TIGR02594 family)